MAITRVDINPQVIRWAIEQSVEDIALFLSNNEMVTQWLSRETKPTLKQLEAFSLKINVPLGFLVLDNPPDEEVIQTSFRTINNTFPEKPNRELIDIINDMTFKQDWMSHYRQELGWEGNQLLGNLDQRQTLAESVSRIRQWFPIFTPEGLNASSQDSAYRLLVKQLEDNGFLVMRTATIFNNTRRKLDPRVFRAFYLHDDFAPLIFINGADSNTAQVFS